MNKKMTNSDCVGCGYCCLKAMCSTGIGFYGRSVERCPYLIWIEDKYRCQLVLDNKAKVATGFGCSSSLNSWRQDVKFRG